MHTIRFLRQFMTKPNDVGAIAPSSKALADAVTAAARVPEAEVIVEFGPGTGAITEAIMARKKPDAQVLAIEKQKEFVDVLRLRFPNIHVVHDSATETKKHLEKLGFEHCDCIVSGLPWTIFPEELQDELLNAVVDALRPGGFFATYMYLLGAGLPGAKRFRKKLAERLCHTGVSSLVWLNIPPAYVFYGEK